MTYQAVCSGLKRGKTLRWWQQLAAAVNICHWQLSTTVVVDKNHAEKPVGGYYDNCRR
jgi:hypothetical protein